MKGMLVALLVVALIGIGVFLFLQNSGENPLTTSQINQTASNTDERQMIEGYEGEVLAGSTTPYVVFNQTDYEKAIADGKIVFLNFYANWCPICRTEQSELFTGFDALELSNVVGFQVNFKDDQTDSVEKGLADQFNVPYQHTKVILVDGNELFNETVQWKTQDLESKLNEIAT